MILSRVIPEKVFLNLYASGVNGPLIIKGSYSVDSVENMVDFFRDCLELLMEKREPDFNEVWMPELFAEGEVR